MVDGLDFLCINEIKFKIDCSEVDQVVIWGTGLIAEEVYRTLVANSVPIVGYADSNTSNCGKEKNSLPIMSLPQIQNIDNIMVVIACFGYAPIYMMLKENGIPHVYGLLDSYKYDYQQLLNDKEIAEVSYKGNYGKILLEIYGNIGDTIMLYGIVFDYIQKYGQKNVWILVETTANAQAYYYLTDNILIFSSDDCIRDNEKRKEIIKKINGIGFEKSYVLTDIRLYAVRRWLNKYTLVNTTVYFDRSVPREDYLPDIEYGFASQQLENENLSLAKNIFKSIELNDWRSEITSAELNLIADKKIVAIHMGATKKIRMYDPIKTEQILKHLIKKNIVPVILGYGSEDDEFWNEVFKHNDYKDKVIYLVSKLSVTQSTRVIKDSCFFVGTESGMWNLSYVLDKPSVVIYGGGDYGNFKHRDKKIHYVVVEDRTCFHCKWYCNNFDENGHANCIYGIEIEKILESIDNVMKENI